VKAAFTTSMPLWMCLNLKQQGKCNLVIRADENTSLNWLCAGNVVRTAQLERATEMPEVQNLSNTV